MTRASCSIHLFDEKVQTCPVCALVLEEIRDRGDSRTALQRAAATQISRNRSRRTARSTIVSKGAAVKPYSTRRKAA